MGKKIMNTVLFLVVLGGCVAMTLLTGNGSSGTMIYNFAFLAVMAVIYLAGLFGGMFRVDSIGEALARGTQELSSIFKIPGKAKSEDLSCLKGMFEHKYLDDRMDSFVRRIRRVHTARRDFHGETAENDKIPAEYTKTKNRAFPCKHESPVSRFICRQASILVFGYFLLKKFIVRSTPIVANDRIASQKTLSRSGIAFRSSSLHSPST